MKIMPFDLISDDPHIYDIEIVLITAFRRISKKNVIKLIAPE